MQKYQIQTTRVKHTTVVLFPLGKLKAEKKKEKKTTGTFVQSRSSMGELSVGRTHTALFTDRVR